MIKTSFQILLVVIISNLLFSCGDNKNSESKEMELLRKETELAKKEADLIRKELELSKNKTINSNVNKTMPSPNLTPTSVPETVKKTKVSVRFVNEARACYIIKGTVTLKSQGKTYTAKTGKKGFATFNNIPCGETATITVFDSESSYTSDKPARSKITCKKSVYLGAFNIYYGNKLSESRANYCYKLNPN